MVSLLDNVKGLYESLHSLHTKVKTERLSISTALVLVCIFITPGINPRELSERLDLTPEEIYSRTKQLRRLNLLLDRDNRAGAGYYTTQYAKEILMQKKTYRNLSDIREIET